MANAPAAYATRRWNPMTGCGPELPCWERCWARSFAVRHAGRFGYPATNPFRPTVDGCQHRDLPWAHTAEMENPA